MIASPRSKEVKADQEQGGEVLKRLRQLDLATVDVSHTVRRFVYGSGTVHLVW